jgi:hypothetical protein
VQIDLLVFDRTPEPFHEHVVSPCAASVHADRDPALQQQAGEGAAGELTSLIGVENFQLAVSGECLFDRVEAGSKGGSRCGTVQYPNHGPSPLRPPVHPHHAGRVKPGDIDAAGHLALGAIVHRLSNASGQLGAAIGMDSAVTQQQRRGFSTFELILLMSGVLRLDAPYIAPTATEVTGSTHMQFDTSKVRRR